MESKEYMALLSKAVDAVKRLSSEGNLDKLKEAKDHVELATDLLYAVGCRCPWARTCG